MVQVMPEADATAVPYHPIDLTKVWPHKDYPLMEVGVMELNRNPEDFFAEVEDENEKAIEGSGFRFRARTAADPSTVRARTGCAGSR